MYIPVWFYWLLAITVLGTLCIETLRRYFNIQELVYKPSVLLELTPPVTTHKSHYSTEQLLHVLGAIEQGRSLTDQVLGRANVLSLEVVSTREEGIRFLARVPQNYTETFQSQLIAYMPEITIREVDDYIDTAISSGGVVDLVEFKQSKHFAFPLARHTRHGQHDPIAYITNSMTQLAPGELILYQLVLSPTAPKEVHKIRDMLFRGKEPNWFFGNLPPLVRMAVFVVSIVFWLIFGILTEIIRPGDQVPARNHFNIVSQEQIPLPTAAYQAILTGLNDKLAEPLFQTSVRAMTITKTPEAGKQRIQSLSAALMAFTVPGYQGLMPRRYFPRWLRLKSRLWRVRNRLPNLFTHHGNVLSASELASLYHFPYSSKSTENVARTYSRTLPAPASLKHKADRHEFDIVIGENLHHGKRTPIGLTEKERERHMYIIGGTGNGKTTLLQYSIIQDIQNGKGVAIIDPHGDMAETLLKHIPPERLKDVIYFNPDDLDHPLGMNLLELTPGLTGNDLLREIDTVTESVVSIFRKIFVNSEGGGHRIEYVLRNAIRTALTVEDATLFTVLKLLQDKEYRKAVTNNLEDGDLKDFWKNELGKAGDMQRVKMAAGITAKIGRFSANAAAKLILGQPRSTINFEDIMDTHKILICNFSKGLLGEDVSELFGITVLAKLQLASLQRARKQQSEREPFYLYVDEFQNFATPSFVQMLSEARKYKLFLTMAEQSTSQQKDQQMVNIILANVGTVITFRTGNPKDEELLLPLFTPFIKEGEIANLSAYNFYARLSSLVAQEPISGTTILLQAEPNPGL